MKMIGEITENVDDDFNAGTEMTTFSIKSTQVEFLEDNY